MDVVDVTKAIATVMDLVPDDQEVLNTLARCNVTLNAIAWDRFRARHEAASQAKRNARKRVAFVARHKR